MCGCETPASCGLQLARGSAIAILATVLVGSATITASSEAGGDPRSIENVAYAGYDFLGEPGQVASNAVVVEIEIPRTPARVEFLRYAPERSDAELVPVTRTDYLNGSGEFEPLDLPSLRGGRGLRETSAIILPLVDAPLYHRGQSLFVRLTDPDQNVDRDEVETVIVWVNVHGTHEAITLRLYETGVDSGEFTGFVDSVKLDDAPSARTLAVGIDSELVGAYVDAEDPLDVARDSARVSPFSRAFDSRTGAAIDGVKVTLVNAASGAPAAVFDDDFAVPSSSSAVSGEPSSGSETVPPGAFRFPTVARGVYRYVVVPPPGYRAPSAASMGDLLALPGGPFMIDDDASRGEAFLVNPGPVFWWDIPLDPIDDGLGVSKTASDREVTIGDALSYTVIVSYAGSGTTGEVTVTDELPVGFRLLAETVIVNGAPATPTVEDDGRAFHLSLDALADTESVEITYSAAVTGGAVLGPAVNRASARSGVAVSNRAEATVTVKDDFHLDRGTIVGRIRVSACGGGDDGVPTAPVTEGEGIAGVRVYLEDGTVTVTDAEGRYHFEHVTPGTHVVQVDLVSLPPTVTPVTCADDSRFSGRAWSRFVDLRGGGLWRADFEVEPVRARMSEVDLLLVSQLESGTVHATADIAVGDAGLRNASLVVVLPAEARIDTMSMPAPDLTGGAATYRLGDLAPGRVETRAFDIHLASRSVAQEETLRAVLLAEDLNGVRVRSDVVANRWRVDIAEDILRGLSAETQDHFASLSAELSEDGKRELDAIVKRVEGFDLETIIVTGHTDSIRVSPRARHIFRDNQALSRARAQSVADYLGRRLGAESDIIEVIGLGPARPIATNKTRAGRALNRRVEVEFRFSDSSWIQERRIIDDRDEARVEVAGRLPVPEPEVTAPEPPPEPVSPGFDAAWLAGAPDSTRWLWPEPGYSPAIPRTKVVVQHPAGSVVRLRRNGVAVDPIFFDGVTKGPEGRRAVSRWAGIRLERGDNVFTAVIEDSTGGAAVRPPRRVYYAGPPVRAEIVESRSLLVADGRTAPRVAVRFYDDRDRPARPGMIGRFDVLPPYLPHDPVDRLRAEPLDGTASGDARYEIGYGGLGYIQLEPTTQVGEVTLEIPFEQRTQALRAWLEPEAREWILVGFAEGTAGYRTLHGNRRAFEAHDLEDDFYEDGRLAFFARGRVGGEALLTLAFDSGRDDSNDPERVLRQVDPDAVFTLYGDATITNYDAVTSRKLYVKLERRQFYALFGDFDTDFDLTELARYSRRVNGLKSRWSRHGVELSGFASETNSDFARAEITPDGTSGRYTLGRTDLVENSEVITLETRDRYRSDRILERDVQIRNLDYAIDTADGTVVFRRPIPTRDEAFNPVTIVAEFETRDGRTRGLRTGGRGSVDLFDGSVQLGATGLREAYASGGDDLLGADARWNLGSHVELRGELARSDRDDVGEGDAYLAEIRLHSTNTDARLYAREQESTFGFDQQASTERGLRKLGAEVAYDRDRKIAFDAHAYHHENLETDGEQNVGQLRTTLRHGDAALRAGYRHVVDRMPNGREATAGQVLVGSKVGVFDDRLRLRADREQNLDDEAAMDYPNRTLLGVDWEIARPVVLTAEHERADDDSVDAESTRLGLEMTAWRGGRATAGVRRAASEYGPRVYANLGLRQTVPITEAWSVELWLEQGRAIDIPRAPTIPSGDDPTFGADEDFVSISAGASRRGDEWSWTNRVEHRHGDREDKWNFVTGLFGDLSDGVAVSAAVNVLQIDPAGSAPTTDGDVRMSMAVRSVPTRWIVLSRLDAAVDRVPATGGYDDSWKVVENLHLNWLPTRRTQLDGHLGVRVADGDVAGDAGSRWTALWGLGARRDLSERVDVGLRTRVRRQMELAVTDYQLGASIGTRFIDNTWVEAGYNVEGFDDADFSDAGFSARGPYATFRLKIDQATLRELLR